MLAARQRPHPLIRASHKQTPLHYGPRQAAYDLKKLRGKHIVRRMGHTRRYEPLPPVSGR